LVTGAAGLIGGVLRKGFGDDYRLLGIDRRRGDSVDWARDMRSARRVRSLFAGVDTVIDLAAMSSPTTSWKDVRRMNVPATLNVLECARLAGVRRVLFASSNHVTGMYERDEPYAAIVAGEYGELEPGSFPRIDTRLAVRPDGPYAVGKALGEAACRYYADAFGLSVICLRIGTVRPSDRPASPRHFATLLTHRDLVQLVRCCIEAPVDLGFAIYYGVSANTWRIWDIESVRAQIGYEPVDDAEHWRAMGVTSG
jgi:uronate dehydrogenase